MAVIHVSGRLGAGKTMYATQQIYDALIAGKEVHTNIRFVDFWAYRVIKTLPVRNIVRFCFSTCGDYRVFERMEMLKIQELYHYHKTLKDFVTCEGVEMESVESSRLMVWDEIHLELNSRDWKAENKAVIRFFTLSRKMGFDVILISQLQGSIDKQIRELSDLSFEIKNLNRFLKFLNFGLLVKRWQNASHRSQGVWKGANIVQYKTNIIRGLYNSMSLLREEAPLKVPMAEFHMCDCCKFKADYLYDKP
jgi:hypothetical protein